MMTEALRRDVDRHEGSIKNLFDMVTGLNASNKLLEQAIETFSKNHTALLTRFDAFAEDYKNHGYILETYMKSVQELRSTQQDFVDIVKEMKFENDRIVKTRLDNIEAKQKEFDDKIKSPASILVHLKEHKIYYALGGIFSAAFVFLNLPPETQIHVLEMLKLYHSKAAP